MEIVKRNLEPVAMLIVVLGALNWPAAPCGCSSPEGSGFAFVATNVNPLFKDA